MSNSKTLKKKLQMGTNAAHLNPYIRHEETKCLTLVSSPIIKNQRTHWDVFIN